MQIDERPLRKYLADTLGLPAHIHGSWAGEPTLPYFLTQAFALREAELAGQPLLFAFARSAEAGTPSEVASRMSRLCMLTARPVVYVSDHMPSYERRRLIQARVAFVVPGRQLFIPYLGLDLREVFPRRVSASDTEFSPAAQALFLRALQAPMPEAWSPSAVMADMGYTAMTASRSASELEDGGLIIARQVGRRRLVSFATARREVWNQARPRLRTPVRHRAWIPSQPANVATPLSAGLSALARTSLLAEPAWPEFAVSLAEWRAAKVAGIETLPEPEAGAALWQVWNYDPRRLSDTAMVDPLSLILSLDDNTDERISEALSQLEERLPW